MNSTKKITQILLFSVISLAIASGSHEAHAHGEDKAGPHGGEIRMPGAFHTEVIKQGRELRVYLLDIMFKEPVVKDCSVEIQVVRAGAAPVALACRASNAATPPHFVCVNPKFELANGDVLKVKAKRGDMTGSEVQYKLPLLSAKKTSAHRADGKTGATESSTKTAAPAHDHGHGKTH